MFDDAGGCLTQNRIDVRLVQNNVYFYEPIRVPIFNFSSCLPTPTEAALSIPKICPPAPCTTWPYLLSKSHIRRMARVRQSFDNFNDRKAPQVLHAFVPRGKSRR